VKRLESAADHGDADGANLFGLCLEFGKGVEVDLHRAAPYYQKAADKGHAEAQYDFGFCLEHGLGVDRNLTEAGKYYRLSADQAHIDGLRSYARFLHYGFGVDQDLEEAAHYYELSANHCGRMFDKDAFRCLRGLNRASLSEVEFCRFSIPELTFFSECQSARPTRSDMLFNFVTAWSSHVLTDVIGRGASSTVFLVNDPRWHGTFAIKRFHPHISDSLCMAEIEILVKLNHPCIVRILKYSLPTNSLQAEIQMEWAANGSLAGVLQLVRSGQPPPFWNPTGISIIVSGIVLGMRFMHSRGFIHQDLNPSNNLVNAEGKTLISDFGSSRCESVEITPTSSGTDQYGAPEMCYDDDWTRQIDVYSFGLILYEILVGSPVFAEHEDPDELTEKQLLGYVPEMGSRVSPFMGQVIRTCLELNPSIRPSFDDILTKLETHDFEVLPGTDKATVREYVRAVTAWELSPH
jgi:hypothetical protein